jgi:predicted small lipoprotein YifL
MQAGMKRPLACLAVLALLASAAGCGKKEPVDPESLTAVVDAPPEPRDEAPGALQEPAGAAPPANTRTAFSCESGEQVVVAWFVQDNHALLTRGDQTMRLERIPAETGLRFASGPTEVAGNAEAFTLTDGLTSTRCVALDGGANEAANGAANGAANMAANGAADGAAAAPPPPSKAPAAG